jgi:hypothetical protein
VSNVTHFYLALDEVNQTYLALSKSAVKPNSCSLKILASSYSTAFVGGSEKRQCSTAASENPPTHILIINQQLPLSPSNSFLQCQLFCCCHVQDR